MFAAPALIWAGVRGNGNIKKHNDCRKGKGQERGEGGKQHNYRQV
jgi:hypothetical protein